MTSDDAGEREFAAMGAALADRLIGALPGWARASVARVGAQLERDPDDVAAATDDAAEALAVALPSVALALAELVGAGVDEQRTTPLSVARTAVAPVTAALTARGWPPVERDGWAVERFPDDRYGLVPAHLGEIDPSLLELATTWGAAKAWLHRRRHERPRVVVCAGMMDASRIRAEADRVEGIRLSVTGSAAALADDLAIAPADLVVVDLTVPGAAGASASDRARRRVGFGPHVDDALLAAAGDAGIETLARSVFFRRLPELLAATARRDPAPHGVTR
jgi:hypothetical protein